MNEKLKEIRSRIEKEFDEKFENMLRGLVIKGYEMGKKQSDTPFEYTCDTDIAKKEWNEIKSFLFSKIEEVLGGKQKEIDEEIMTLWGIIANVSGGNWDLQNKEWQDAVIKWRTDYFGTKTT